MAFAFAGAYEAEELQVKHVVQVTARTHKGPSPAARRRVTPRYPHYQTRRGAGGHLGQRF